MRNVYMLILVLLAMFVASGDAFACRRNLEVTAFHNHVPSGTNAPLVARLTVTEVTPSENYQWQWSGIAQVDEVINGRIDSPSIKATSHSDHAIG